jgi:hypothetical protein
MRLKRLGDLVVMGPSGPSLFRVTKEWVAIYTLTELGAAVRASRKGCCTVVPSSCIVAELDPEAVELQIGIAGVEQ